MALGAGFGLLLGKPIGVAGGAWLAVRTGLTRLPAGASWPGVIGVGLLAGIGFTMALFVADLAFGKGPLLDQAKIGVLAASVLAALLGLMFLSRALPRAGGPPATAAKAKAGRAGLIGRMRPARRLFAGHRPPLGGPGPRSQTSDPEVDGGGGAGIVDAVRELRPIGGHCLRPARRRSGEVRRSGEQLMDREMRRTLELWERQRAGRRCARRRARPRSGGLRWRSVEAEGARPTEASPAAELPASPIIRAVMATSDRSGVYASTAKPSC